MSKQRVKIEPIEVPDILAERAPFWYARLKTVRKLDSLNNSRTIQVGDRRHNTSLSIPKSSIAGEIHGFTGRYRYGEPKAIFGTLCSTCDDLVFSLSYAAEYINKDEFEDILKYFAEHIVEEHPQKISSQGA